MNKSDQQDRFEEFPLSLSPRRPAAFILCSPMPVAPARIAVIALASACAANAQTPPQPPAAAASAAVELPTVKVSARQDHATEGTGAYTTGTTTTATKMGLSLRETPQSISIVTRTQIDDFALRSVNDLLGGVTGVNVERVETDRTYFSVRGFDVSNFQLDGIGLPFTTGDQLGDIDTAFYDRVEVLRGANGLMSSTGNPSATVNFVRKRPTAEFQVSAGFTVGSWNNRRLDGDVSTALNDAGTVRARLVSAVQEKDSWLDRYSLQKNLFSGIVEADLAPGTLLAVGHSQQHNKPTSPMWGTLPLYDSEGGPTNYQRSASTAADWAYWNTDDTQTFAEITQQLSGGWQAKAVAMRRVLASDAELLYIYGSPDRSTGMGLFTWPSKYEHTERQWMADAYLSGPVALAGRRHELVLGVNTAKSDNTLHSSDDDVAQEVSEEAVLSGSVPRPAFDAGTSGFADFHDRRHSLYAAARLNLADDLKLITGANLTRATSGGVQYGERHAYAKTKATPYLGATYDLGPQASVYASYARIFNPQFKIDRSNALLPPIEGSNAELGVKGEWFAKRLTGSLAVFRTRQDNTAEFDIFTDGRSTYKGVHAQSTGFELDLAGR
ncbi:TonB-dependent siderophore receptor, partial [Piscinibacter sp.]|uniref:TonB-dependent siderophore receptor n=1 Tax=Piscinibacter sp. TaxID=1903157 RepID=UPI002B6FAAA7